MTLLEEVRAAGPAPSRRCSVAAVREALSPADASDLDELLSDPRTSISALVRSLKARGHRVSDFTLRRHRRGECLCDVTS